ncbi:hypothetical protein LB572_01205 [Mesorhizobium sp. BH1-1-5]|nr:hypothetical protein [Mesorhizobium sp. BH1-1-5]MBZ9985707.1 hypothetical protein [Mesorhizobium sp. BH1-1-5]
MTSFRIHYADGKRIIVDAETPKDATTKAAQTGYIGIITKIKLAKDVNRG